MRAFFLFVLLANLAFFAWANFLPVADAPPEASPLERQIAADKLRIVPAGPPAQPAAAKPTGETAAAAKPALEAAVAQPAAVLACMEWGGFPAAEAARGAEMLAPLGLGSRLSQRAGEDSASWWVFIAAQGGRQGALKKAAELRALGVDDYFILPEEGQPRYAVSLGLFKTEAAAASRLEALRARGVKTAQIGARDTRVLKVYFQVRPVEEALAAKLRDIAKALPGMELRECPPNQS